MGNQASSASRLYILGDLFDAWAGDDDLDDPFNRKVVESLERLVKKGVRLHVMHGNRDFLLGRSFFERAGAVHLPDPYLIDLNGEKTLLTHGDMLCTADAEYQAFRKEVRDESWQSDFLMQPLFMRKEVISRLREKSEEKKQEKSMEIMDVDQEAVESLMRKYDCSRLIHGHTHRPARHQFLMGALSCERWVLGDWRESSALCLQGEDGKLDFVDAANR